MELLKLRDKLLGQRILIMSGRSVLRQFKIIKNVVDKIKNETELDANDITAIAEYGKRYPGKELPENVKDAVRKYVESKVNGDITSNDLGELLDLIRDTSLEELAKETISKLSSTNPNYQSTLSILLLLISLVI